jgi:hypothetical protein
MVKHILNLVLLTVTLTATIRARADIHLGVDAGIIQDQKSITSRDVIQTSFYDGYLYVQAGRSYPIYLGFEYIYISTTQPNTTATNTATLTSSNVMAAAKYVFGRRELYALSIMGSPFIQANYKITGSPSDLWSGSAFAGKFTVQPELSSSVKLCFSLIYYSASYTSKSESSGSTTVNGFTRSLIMPSLGLQLNF